MTSLTYNEIDLGLKIRILVRVVLEGRATTVNYAVGFSGSKYFSCSVQQPHSS